MVRIITDSASDLRGREAKAMEIEVLPMTIQFGDEAYLDGVDLEPQEFYTKLIESDALPTTSQIAPFTFEEAFAKVAEAGDEAVVILLSSDLSGTVQSAKLAATDYEGIYIVDSRNVTVGEQCLVQYANRLRHEGKTAKEIFEILEACKEDVKVLALLDTLEYLKKGGRISAGVAIVGGVLAIKPVVTVMDGKVEMLGKARGSRNGNNMLMEMVQKSGGINFDMPVNLAYSGLDSTLLKKYIQDSKVLWDGRAESLPISRIGSTIGTHVGPGTVAVAFFRNE